MRLSGLLVSHSLSILSLPTGVGIGTDAGAVNVNPQHNDIHLGRHPERDSGALSTESLTHSGSTDRIKDKSV